MRKKAKNDIDLIHVLGLVHNKREGRNEIAKKTTKRTKTGIDPVQRKGKVAGATETMIDAVEAKKEMDMSVRKRNGEKMSAFHHQIHLPNPLRLLLLDSNLLRMLRKKEKLSGRRNKLFLKRKCGKGEIA